MQLIDTHTHLYLPDFDNDRDEVVAKAINSDIKKLLMPNIDIHSIVAMIAVENRYPGICHPMIGLHPTSVKADFIDQLDVLEKLVTNHNFIAVGEIGIDLYWDKTFIEEQVIAFKRQILFALDLDLPVVIHSRESFPLVFSLLEEFKGRPLKGVFHAFSGTSDNAQKAIGFGFKIGIGGILTFKNSGLDKVVQDVGLDNLVLETDSPYLAPSPYRGKRNESSYICIINRKLAEIFGIDAEEVASITYTNSLKIFNI
jgi:TatD DNase family protein